MSDTKFFFNHLLLYGQPFQNSVVHVIKQFSSMYQLGSWGRSTGCWSCTVPLSNFSKPNRQPRSCISHSSGWSTKRQAQLVQTHFKPLLKSLICQPPIGQCKSHDQAQHALPQGDV